jgi:hypothetical protein
MVVTGGTYNVQVTPPAGSSFGPVIAFSQAITSNATLNFTLAEAGVINIKGHVYDPFGNPLQNQTVTLLKFSDGSQIDTTTDVNGAYSFNNASSANYRFTVKSSGNSSSVNIPQTYFVFGSLTPTQNTILDITIPAKRIVVHVKDNANVPVSGVAISAGAQGGPGNPVNLSLPFGNMNGSAEVSYGQNSPASTTDSSGNVVLWLLPNNDSSSGFANHLYDVTVIPPSGSVYTQTVVSNLSVTSEVNRDVALQHPVSLTGVISDPLGNLLPNQTVTLLRYSDSTQVTSTTNSNGEYSFTNISGGANHQLKISSSNNNPSLNVPQTYSIFGDYTPTENTELNITIPSKKVIVHVQDRYNSPLENISIEAGPQNGRGNPINLALSINGGITATAVATYGKNAPV